MYGKERKGKLEEISLLPTPLSPARYCSGMRGERDGVMYAICCI
jgi:hypothetical protein